MFVPILAPVWVLETRILSLEIDFVRYSAATYFVYRKSRHRYNGDLNTETKKGKKSVIQKKFVLANSPVKRQSLKQRTTVYCSLCISYTFVSETKIETPWNFKRKLGLGGWSGNPKHNFFFALCVCDCLFVASTHRLVLGNVRRLTVCFFTLCHPSLFKIKGLTCWQVEQGSYSKSLKSCDFK